MAQVQLKTAVATTTDVSAVFDAAPTEGNWMVAVVFGDSPTTDFSITGWTAEADKALGQSGWSTVVFFKKAGAGESSTVTSHCASATTIHQIHIFEYAGLDATDPFVTTPDTSGSASSTSCALGSVTTGVDGEIALAAVGIGGTYTAPSWTDSFVAQGTTSRLITAELTLGAAGAYMTTASWTSARGNAGVLLTMRPASGGGLSGTASLTETATITATGTVGVSTAAALTTTAAITTAGVVGAVGEAALTATATITATGTVTSGPNGAASVSVTATITATGVVGRRTSATLTATATITATGAVGVLVFIFRTPTVRFRLAGRRLPYRRFQLDQGVTVLQLVDGGPFTEVQAAIDSEVTAAFRHYRGGYENVITLAEKDALVSAGYGAYIT